MKRTPIYRPSTTTGPLSAGQARYGSALGSFLTSITDSILNGSDSDFESGSETTPHHLPALTSRFFSSASAADDSSRCLITSVSSYCKDTCDDAGTVDPKHLLTRQSSSPAIFFSHLLLDNSLFYTTTFWFPFLSYAGVGTIGNLYLCMIKHLKLYAYQEHGTSGNFREELGNLKNLVSMDLCGKWKPASRGDPKVLWEAEITLISVAKQQ